MSQTMALMLVALAGEAVLLVLVLLVVAVLRSRAQRRRDLKAVKTLIARLKSGKSEREAAIVQYLEQRMGLSGAALDAARVAVLRSELGLLQRFAGIYRLRDAAALARIDDDLFGANAAYHALPGEAVSAVDARETGDAATADDGELEQLRSENQRLSDELTITMETMSRMLNEYSTMFAGSESDDAAPISATAGPAETEADPVATPVAGVADTEPDPDPRDAPVAPADGDPDVAEPADTGTDGLDPEDGQADVEIAPRAAETHEAGTEIDVDASEAAAGDDEDEIAVILREAQSREAMARAEAAKAAAGEPLVDVTVESSGDTPIEIEEGEAEIVAFDDTGDPEVAVIDDIDALFDAAVDGDGDANGDGDGVPRKSQSGSPT